MATTVRIRLPHRITLRRYQADVFAAFDRGMRRFVNVWPRRHGKDRTWYNLMVREAATGRVGNYYYVFPTYTQGWKALWSNIDDGFRVIDHCPPELVSARDNSRMLLTLANGSTIQIVGSDNPDSLRGPNPCGVVFSEYSEQSPMAWQVVKPILVENEGWAGFNFTPRGLNHAHDLYEEALADPLWFVSLLTVEDIGILSAAQIAEARKGTSEEFFRQEYYCDFAAGNVGAYYGRLMADALAQGRIGMVPHDPALKVHTIWDVGTSDATAIGFVQVKGNAIFGIDYYANNSEGFDHYQRIIEDKGTQLGYRYGVHIGPHDIGQRNRNDGKSYQQYAQDRGFHFVMLPNSSIESGREAVRMILPRMYWHRETTVAWVAALRAYTKKYNEALQVWSDEHLHDWASHPADMTRYLAQAEKAGLLVDSIPTIATPKPYRPAYQS